MSKPASAHRVALKALPRFVLLAAALAAAAMASCNDVGDQLCPYDTNYNEKDDPCPYGPPGGLKGALSQCEPVPAPAIDCAEAPTWTDVVAIFDAVNCTASSCHGTGRRKVLLPKGDPDAIYKALTQYIGGQDTPYINASNPSRSWILCNFRDEVGYKMPIGNISDEQIQQIQDWVSCGAKN